MKTTRKSATVATVGGRFDSKTAAQGAIKLAKAFLTANGRKFKLVSFIHTHSEYSALHWYYVVQIAFECAPMSSEEFEAFQTARILGCKAEARIF